jgi:hypothetical protein
MKILFGDFSGQFGREDTDRLVFGVEILHENNANYVVWGAQNAIVRGRVTPNRNLTL